MSHGNVDTLTIRYRDKLLSAHLDLSSVQNYKIWQDKKKC